MNPEDKNKLNEIWNWMKSRMIQQISYPLDDASRNTLNVVQGAGSGSHALTQSVPVATTPPSSINVPAAYIGTVLITIEGVTYEIPYIQTV